MGHVLDYILSSILDTKVFHKIYVEPYHYLVVSKVRLKLQAKRKRAQKDLRHQVDLCCLDAQQVEEFRKNLAEEIRAGPVGEKRNLDILSGVH